MYSTYI